MSLPRLGLFLFIYMSDKRKVSTDALETLGTIITGGGRDAIHLAVEPVTAGEILVPGQHIGLKEGNIATTEGKTLGIVDPFLSKPIQIGEQFWLVVYPRQITSLRHVWTHPDFEEKAIDRPKTQVEISQEWINDFADRIRQHPQSLMDAANLWIEDEEYTYDNSESYKDHWNEFTEFWEHYEVVTGRKPKDNGSFFTCSC